MCGALAAEKNAEAKDMIDRIVAMLTKLGHRGYSVREELAEFSVKMTDTDTDSDSDSPSGS
ncbi:hypothetical protein D3OALGA1CA_2301 [Olavius algarvensis associated proteobacterium Delta 3]|nr:hypothetical protein D3OALGB2SA_202 [Olavius algarvensis associated proteobacterium Delta 3]CAB5116605.1 hypothetical protein D3OALGA1CA_2301 [Olavius algarvensis associated proteobacterium Delta 3]